MSEKILNDMLRKLRLSGLADSLEMRFHEATAWGCRIANSWN